LSEIDRTFDLRHVYIYIYINCIASVSKSYNASLLGDDRRTVTSEL